VRYTTADGRRLRVDREVHVDPIQGPGGWTPAARSLSLASSPDPTTTVSATCAPSPSPDHAPALAADGDASQVSTVPPDPDAIGTPGPALAPCDTPPPTRAARRRRPEWRPYR
jgi:hypothetical protein